jgi:hypothetical protein
VGRLRLPYRWTPNPTVEHVPHAELLAMCDRPAHDFAAWLAAVGPAVAELAPFTAWQPGRLAHSSHRQTANLSRTDP